MNYEELSLEERIDKAAEYAVLLSSDREQDDAFLDELGSMFNLTREQAREAYKRMRDKHAAAYKKVMNEKIRYAGQAFLVLALMTGMYFFMASEVATGMYVFVFLLGAGAIGWLFTAVNWSAEKVKTADRLFPKRKDVLSFQRIRNMAISLIVGGVAIWVLYYFVSGKNLSEKDLQLVNGVVLAKSEQTKTYVGKGKRTALDFIFFVQGTGQQLKFRVLPDDDPDGKKYVNSWDFSAGTRIDVLMKKEDAQDFVNRNGEGPFKVYNVKLKGLWLVNLEQVDNENNKKLRSFAISSLCLIAVGLMLLFNARRLKNGQ